MMYTLRLFFCRNDPICISVFVHVNNDGQKVLHHETS